MFWEKFWILVHMHFTEKKNSIKMWKVWHLCEGEITYELSGN